MEARKTNNQRIEDAVFEGLFRQAVIDSYEEEIDALPSNDELAKLYPLNPAFEKRMMQLIARERRKGRIEKALRTARKAAAVFIIAMAVLFGIVLTQPAGRAAVGQIVVEWYEKFTSFAFKLDEGEVSSKEWYPAYLPEGYVEVAMERMHEAANIIFQTADGKELRFWYEKGSELSLYVDNEQHELCPILVGECEGYAASAEREGADNGVLWINSGYVFRIWSLDSLEELIRVAESVSEKS